jgi:4-amino-4-deoxy-L-arabinose transferase-like glycosyltransferase
LPQDQRATKETGYLLPLIACLAALLALRLAAIYAAKIDLVSDEAQYWTWSRELAFGYFSKPPMIAWIIRGTSAFCGDGEACIRSASPVLYTLAAVVTYLTGRALFGERIGFWSAIVLDTLPGVSYSSLLITTDVPLILFWTIALYFWVMLVREKSMAYAVLFGVAVGLGLLAKQAMIYAVLCAACHAAISREARAALKGGRGIVAALVALAVFAPNIVWNAHHGFPTVKHTGANIGWQYPYVHPLQLIEYIIVQLGVFGPILILVLARTAWREITEPQDPRKALLLCFSLPVLAILTTQAVLSRAHGNWSATAYPAATILVTAAMIELERKILFAVSLCLHLAVAVLLAIAPALARQWSLFERVQFLSQVVGWQGVADAVRTKLDQDHYGSILVDSRDLAAELLYYLRDSTDSKVPLYVWPSGPSPTDHYEMTRAFASGAPEPVLFVSLKRCPRSVLASFREVTDLGAISEPMVKSKTRVLHFCRLAGYKGR